MDRGCTIIFILLSISVYGSGFSSGNWFEISGCYSLGGTIIKSKTSLLANEPGGCLEWCGTKTVALQNSTCLCINDDQKMNRTLDYYCSQSCNGEEETFKCGGNSSNHISVYREREEISAKWRSLNGSECLTYIHKANPKVSEFVPGNCTEKHPFYCFSEIKFLHGDCYMQIHIDLNNNKTWREAMEDCRPLYTLWPAQNTDICGDKNEGMFWVAVYQWTKDVPTSTISSTTTAPSSATPQTSTTLSTTIVTKSNTYTSTMTPSISTISGNPSTTTAGTSTTSTNSLSATSTSSTTMAPNIAAILSTNSSSMTTSTSTSAKTTRSSGPPTSTNGNEPATSVTSGLTSNFQIDPPNLGLGIAIGSVVGFLISITIAYCWRRMCTRLFQRKRAFDNATYEIERL